MRVCNSECPLSDLGDLSERVGARWAEGAGEAGCSVYGRMWGFIILFLTERFYSRSQEGVTFPSTLLSIPQPHRGIIFLMEVESLRPPVTWWVPHAYNEFWMSVHICRRFPRMNQTCRKICSQVYFKRRHNMWFGVFMSKCRKQGRLVMLYIYVFTVNMYNIGTITDLLCHTHTFHSLFMCIAAFLWQYKMTDIVSEFRHRPLNVSISVEPNSTQHLLHSWREKRSRGIKSASWTWVEGIKQFCHRLMSALKLAVLILGSTITDLGLEPGLRSR